MYGANITKDILQIIVHLIIGNLELGLKDMVCVKLCLWVMSIIKGN